MWHNFKVLIKRTFNVIFTCTVRCILYAIMAAGNVEYCQSLLGGIIVWFLPTKSFIHTSTPLDVIQKYIMKIALRKLKSFSIFIRRTI